MSEPVSIPEAEPTTRRAKGARQKTILLAALLSAVIPGMGHFLLRKRSTGTVFLSMFSILLLLYCLFRIPKEFGLLIAAYLCILALCVWSGCHALLRGNTPELKISKWWVLMVLPIAVLAYAGHTNWMLRAAGFQILVIPSQSMESTVLQGDKLIVDERWYRHSPPSSGDIIIFRKDNYYVIKRVAAIAGSTIYGKNGKIRVDGKELDEPYVQHIFENSVADPQLNNFGPVTVPSGKLFVLGDNRDISLDSRTRDYGLIDTNAVIAKPLYVIFSPKNPEGYGRTID